MGHPHFWRFAQGDDKDVHWANLPEPLKDQINDYVDGLTDHDLGSPCIWLDMDDRTCKHYEHRPQMCRDFEMGGEHCRRIRLSEGIDRG